MPYGVGRTRRNTQRSSGAGEDSSGSSLPSCPRGFPISYPHPLLHQYQARIARLRSGLGMVVYTARRLGSVCPAINPGALAGLEDRAFCRSTWSGRTGIPPVFLQRSGPEALSSLAGASPCLATAPSRFRLPFGEKCPDWPPVIPRLGRLRATVSSFCLSTSSGA